jgi:hypothetical protein
VNPTDNDNTKTSDHHNNMVTDCAGTHHNTTYEPAGQQQEDDASSSDESDEEDDDPPPNFEPIESAVSWLRYNREPVRSERRATPAVADGTEAEAPHGTTHTSPRTPELPGEPPGTAPTPPRTPERPGEPRGPDAGTSYTLAQLGTNALGRNTADFDWKSLNELLLQLDANPLGRNTADIDWGSLNELLQWSSLVSASTFDMWRMRPNTLVLAASPGTDTLPGGAGLTRGILDSGALANIAKDGTPDDHYSKIEESTMQALCASGSIVKSRSVGHTRLTWPRDGGISMAFQNIPGAPFCLISMAQLTRLGARVYLDDSRESVAVLPTGHTIVLTREHPRNDGAGGHGLWFIDMEHGNRKGEATVTNPTTSPPSLTMAVHDGSGGNDGRP